MLHINNFANFQNVNIPRQPRSIATGLMELAFAFAFAGPVFAADPSSDIFVSAPDSMQQVVSIEAVVGKTPKTVFVPGHFNRDKRGALFIDGQRFVTTSGATDVAGFISGDAGYLIAVHANVTDFTEQTSSTSVAAQTSRPLFSEEELQKLPPEMRLKALQMMGGSATPQESVSGKFGNGDSNATVFYKCISATSCSIARILRGLPDLQIAENMIWFVVPTLSQRVGGELVEFLVSYSGIGFDGKSVDGPRSVLYAAPLPKGDWVIKRLDRSEGWKHDYSWVIRAQDGSDRVLFSATDRADDFLQFVEPKSIVVDGTPISPSVAYGTVVAITGGYDKGWRTTNLYNRPFCATKASKDRLQGMSFSWSDNQLIAKFAGEQIAVIPVDGKVYAFGQATMKTKNVLGMLDVDCENGDFSQKGAEGKKTYGYIEPDSFWLSSGNPSAIGLGGFVHIKSPNGNLLILTGRMKEGKPLPGILVENGKRIETSEIIKFFDRYGIVNQ